MFVTKPFFVNFLKPKNKPQSNKMSGSPTPEQVSCMREAAVLLEKLHIPRSLSKEPFTRTQEHNACVKLYNAFRKDGQKLIRNVYDMTAEICEKHDDDWRVEMAKKCYLQRVKAPEDWNSRRQVDKYYAQLITMGILLDQEGWEIHGEDYETYVDEVKELEGEIMSKFNETKQMVQ